MELRRSKIPFFVLEGIHAFATTYYFSYLFFYCQKFYHTGWTESLGFSALNGGIYMSVAWFGGRCAQRYGYLNALRFGFGLITLALVMGGCLSSLTGQLGVVALWTLGVSFTWPTLEAMVSEKETRLGLARQLGIYNVTWAASGFVANFVGGALVEHLSWRSVFWLPAALHLIQIGWVQWLVRQTRHTSATSFAFPEESIPPRSPEPGEANPHNRTFLRMAWLANPFGYIAINTVVPVIPYLAARFHLSPTLAGFVGSVWLFGRLAAFIGLWQWPGWHYRFAWLFGAYVAVAGSYAVLLLVPNLVVILGAQILLGLGVGLIYYSSLFYSMDVGEAKGEHGGWHESAIGAGLFTGPAVGATTQYLLPNQANSGVFAVSGLLLIGAVGLLVLKRNGRVNVGRPPA